MIQCIAIDDEPLALKQIAEYIKKTPFLELKGAFESAFQALDFLGDEQVDLMFVDINMPDLNGMEFVKSLNNSPRVIFTTAYSEYAIDGFKVNAIDYILKPIGYSDFLKAAEKARIQLSSKIETEEELKREDEYLFIKSEYKILRINLSEIKYIEGMREYVRFHLKDQKPIMALMSMKKLDEFLPQSDFLRVHRSFIVRLDKVTTIERSRIIFDGKVYIPVSEQYKDKFQEFMNKNFLT